MSARPGDELGPWFGTIGADAVAELAVILDDPNPIHLDPAAARAAGLGERAIVQGPASMAFVINMLREAVADCRLGKLGVRLLGSICVDDAVRAAGRVESVTVDGGERLLSCDVWLDIIDGPRALEGSATLLGPAAEI